MATGVPDTGSIKLGPWLGHDDGAVAGSSYVRNSLNVVFETPSDGGPPRISRRPGRMGWLTFAADPARRIANLIVYVSRTGAREMMVWLDPATSSSYDAKIYRLDGTAPTGVALALPNSHAKQRQGGSIPAIQLYDHLLFLDSFGRPMVYDGITLTALEALLGANADQTDESYLITPPTGRFILGWRNRVVIMGGEDAPRTIGMSASNGSPEVPYDAPVGGANVWPSYSNFDVQTDEGDEITGGCVLQDRLVVTTRRTVTVVDEDAVSPIARVKARHAGCVAPRTLVSIGDHVVFLGDRRVFAFNGETLENVSKPVERILREWVNWSAAEDAIAVNYGSKREYRIWLPVVGDGSNRNRLCLVWNYGSKTWRVAAGWYLFDRESRRGAANHYEVTCAVTHLLSDAEEVLLTGAPDSTIFMEDVGESTTMGPRGACSRPTWSSRRSSGARSTRRSAMSAWIAFTMGASLKRSSPWTDAASSRRSSACWTARSSRTRP